MRTQEEQSIAELFYRTFGTMIANALLAAGYTSLEQVAETSNENLLRTNNIGKASVYSIRRALGQAPKTSVESRPPGLLSYALTLDGDRLAALEGIGVKDFRGLSNICSALGLRARIVIGAAERDMIEEEKA